MRYFSAWTNCIAGLFVGILINHYSNSFPSLDHTILHILTKMSSSLKAGDTFPEGVKFS